MDIRGYLILDFKKKMKSFSSNLRSFLIILLLKGGPSYEQTIYPSQMIPCVKLCLNEPSCSIEEAFKIPSSCAQNLKALPPKMPCTCTKYG